MNIIYLLRSGIVFIGKNYFIYFFSKKNKEILEKARKKSAKSIEGTKAREEIHIQEGMPKTYIDFIKNRGIEESKVNKSQEMKKKTNQKRRPESREKKAYKQVIKEIKEVPKNLRHQKQKKMRNLRSKKKRLVKEVIDAESRR